MNTTLEGSETRFAGGLPEFLAALERLYRCLGLGLDDARAATFADAESFAPEPFDTEFAA